MSRLTESWRAVRVFNPHNFYGDEVYITWRKAVPHSLGAAWLVRSHGEDLSHHWSDYGARPVYPMGAGSHRDRKLAALLQAQDWASERYGVQEWKKDPYGGYGPAEYVVRRTRELTELVREAGGMTTDGGKQ